MFLFKFYCTKEELLYIFNKGCKKMRTDSKKYVI